MKFGTFLFSECLDPSHDHQVIAETLHEARLSEELGMDAVWLAEHHFNGYCVYVDPATFAASLAMTTRKVKIGFSVLQASLYHPVRLAEQISLLDHLSSGRMIVGLGRGTMYNAYEYEGFQVPENETRERLDEVEEVMLKAWSGEPVDHHGKFWQVKFPMLRPSPFTKPHPVLMRAVSSEAALIRQAQLGRSFLLSGSTNERLRDWIGLARATMRESGFEADRIDQAIDELWTWQHVTVAETDEEAEIGLNAFRDMLQKRLKSSPSFASRLGPSGVPDGFIYGSPETVLTRFRQLQATGIGSALIRFRIGDMPFDFALNSLRLFMTKVAPALR